MDPFASIAIEAIACFCASRAITTADQCPAVAAQCAAILERLLKTPHHTTTPSAMHCKLLLEDVVAHVSARESEPRRKVVAVRRSQSSSSSFSSHLVAAVMRTEHNMYDLFKMLDSDGDGILSAIELQNAFRALNFDAPLDDITSWMEQHGMQQMLSETFINAIRADNVSLQELFRTHVVVNPKFQRRSSSAFHMCENAALRDLMRSVVMQCLQLGSPLETVFRTMDSNQNRMLSVDELGVGLMKLGVASPDPVLLQQLMWMYDGHTTVRGAQKSMCVDEFICMVQDMNDTLQERFHFNVLPAESHTEHSLTKFVQGLVLRGNLLDVLAGCDPGCRGHFTIASFSSLLQSLSVSFDIGKLNVGVFGVVTLDDVQNLCDEAARHVLWAWGRKVGTMMGPNTPAMHPRVLADPQSRHDVVRFIFKVLRAPGTLLDLFGRWNKNADGAMSSAELSTGLLLLNVPPTDSFVELLMNGKTFLKSYDFVTLLDAMMKNVTRFFQDEIANVPVHKARILGEMALIVKRYAARHSVPNAAALFAALDVDGDGVIAWHEFMSFVQEAVGQRCGVLTAREAVLAFNWMDPDRDGVLDGKEFCAFLGNIE